MGRYLDIIEEYGMSSNAQGSAVRRRKLGGRRCAAERGSKMKNARVDNMSPLKKFIIKFKTIIKI